MVEKNGDEYSIEKTSKLRCFFGSANHKIVRLVDSFLVKNFGRESNKLPLFINDIFIFLLTQIFICNIWNCKREFHPFHSIDKTFRLFPSFKTNGTITLVIPFGFILKRESTIETRRAIDLRNWELRRRCLDEVYGKSGVNYSNVY